MVLKPNERLEIIAEYIKTGKSRPVYKVIETKEGKCRVSIALNEKDVNQKA